MAQSSSVPTVSVEATSDLRRRGISWSNGDPTLSLSASVPLTSGLSVELSGAGLRDSRRHGGANLLVEPALRYDRVIAGWRVGGGVIGHIFSGQGNLDYVELEGRASYMIGPASVGLDVGYAPDQSAIGGDNLYLGATTDLGLPGTPFTFYADIGRSSGKADDAVRSARLRPDGTYWSGQLGMAWVRGPLLAGVSVSATSIDRSRVVSPFTDSHVGTRARAYLRFTL